VVYYSGYILMLIIVIYINISYNGVRIYIPKGVFGFYVGGESVAVSQCTIAVVVANKLVEHIYTKLRLVFT